MKVAILGTENTHASDFIKLMKTSPDFSEFEIIGVYGYDKSANLKLKEKYPDLYFADDFDEFTENTEAVIVTARHGDNHYKYAMPYLKKGINAFIDKPFAIDCGEAGEMIMTAEKTGALISGGSSLKQLDEIQPVKEFVRIKKSEGKFLGGHVVAPINMVNDYGGFHFYAAHLIEIVLNCFGNDIISVFAFCPDTSKNSLHVVFRYDGFEVTGRYYDSYNYGVTVYSKTGPFSFSTSDIGYLNGKELSDFANMLKTGKMLCEYSDFLIPVKIQNAIQKSYSENKEIRL